MQFTIKVSHDDKEGVWFVQESNVPGLNAEAATLDALVEVIADLAPDLVSANVPDADNLTLCIQHVVETRAAHAA